VIICVLSALALTAARTGSSASSAHSHTDAGSPSGTAIRTADAGEVGNSLTPQGAIQPGPVQNVRFTLYDAGIYPRQLHAKTGNVAIGIEDRTGNSLGLVVEHQNGSVAVLVGQVRCVLNRLRGRAQFSLEPGIYAVFDATRPNNRAELVVEP
jgi:hypothetical protein